MVNQDSCLVRRSDLAHQFAGFTARLGRCERFGKFNVGGVIGVRTICKCIFARIGQYVEFVRTGSPNRTGIRGDSAEFQSQTGKNSRVSVKHIAVFALQIVKTGVERVTVLHQKFAAAHDAETGTDLVTEFRLDLVEV